MVHWNKKDQICYQVLHGFIQQIFIMLIVSILYPYLIFLNVEN